MAFCGLFIYTKRELSKKRNIPSKKGCPAAINMAYGTPLPTFFISVCYTLSYEHLLYPQFPQVLHPSILISAAAPQEGHRSIDACGAS